MGDFEDATSPTWRNMMEGQINLYDLWRGKIDFTDPKNGKFYSLNKDHAVLIIRPRGWHLNEEHLKIKGEFISGGIFDFGLYLFHNHSAQLAQNTGPYFYLPKMESHLEARLWNDIFIEAQSLLGIDNGTIKATVLIETLPAAFEMDESIYELKDHMAGLNCGRWDYIFSFIKTLQAHEDYILPDRAQVGMDRSFLEAYSKLLIKTCHKRGAFAMGGMAAAIPNRKDEAVNKIAFAKVEADKYREARNGHDGTWVAHPDLVPVAMKVFNEIMPQANQLDKSCDDYDISEKMMLAVHSGTKTEIGIKENIRVGIQYIEAWLRGAGAVPLYNLMEDAATAEISRAQVWQLIKFKARLECGTIVTPEYVGTLLRSEMKQIELEVTAEHFKDGRFAEALELFKGLIFEENFKIFLTLGAYQMIK
jgi:malate synthase